MKYYITLILICFSTVISAEGIGSDFWKECPGPACPSNKSPVEIGSDFWKHCLGPACPENAPSGSMEYKMKKTEESFKKMDTPELIERELKLKQEIKAIKGEKQRRKAM